MKRIIKWFKTPILPGKPQSSPILILCFATALLIITNFPFSENTIVLTEVIMVYSVAVIFIGLAHLVAWYKEGKEK